MLQGSRREYRVSRFAADDAMTRRLFGGIPVLESLFTGSAVGLALLDRQLNYVWINRALAEMNGMSIEQHVGRRLSEVLPDIAEVAVPIFERVLASGEPVVDWELSGETAALPGRTRHWLENIYPLRDGKDIVGLGAVVVEITDRKLAEQRLADAERTTSKLLHDLEAALVPRASVRDRWSLAWRYHPSEDRMLLGGDFIGVHERPDGSLSLVIGDVSGRGAAAAGVGAMLRGAWLTSLHADIRLEDIPGLLDRLLAAHGMSAVAFASACFAEIDSSGRELRLIRAGHEPPLLVTSGAVSFIDGEHGPVLGIDAAPIWPLQRVALESNSALLLYTDGLSEYRPTPSAPRLGLEPLRAHAAVAKRALLARSPERALDELLGSILGAPARNRVDDLAAVLIRVDGAAAAD
jgi:PAS domain S-box-containing protein